MKIIQAIEKLFLLLIGAIICLEMLSCTKDKVVPPIEYFVMDTLSGKADGLKDDHEWFASAILRKQTNSDSLYSLNFFNYYIGEIGLTINDHIMVGNIDIENFDLYILTDDTYSDETFINYSIIQGGDVYGQIYQFDETSDFVNTIQITAFDVEKNELSGEIKAYFVENPDNANEYPDEVFFHLINFKVDVPE